MIAVNNEILMGNHQLEILEVLQDNGYVFGCLNIREVNDKVKKPL